MAEPRKRATRRKTAKPEQVDVVDTPVIVGRGRQQRTLDGAAQLGIALPAVANPAETAAPAPRAKRPRRKATHEQPAMFDLDG